MPRLPNRAAMRLPALRPLVLCLPALLLGACVDPASLAFTGASAVSAVETNKTIPDHIMSLATGDECSYQHQIAGEAWCKPVPADAGAEPVRYCYASIAATTCYSAKNPYETRSRRMP